MHFNGFPWGKQPDFPMGEIPIGTAICKTKTKKQQQLLRRFLQHTQWVVGHILLPLTRRGPHYIYSLLSKNQPTLQSSAMDMVFLLIWQAGLLLLLLPLIDHCQCWPFWVTLCDDTTMYKKKKKKDEPHHHSLFVCDCLTLTLVRVVRQPSVSFYHAKQTCGCKGCGIENEVSTLASSFHRLLFNVSE